MFVTFYSYKGGVGRSLALANTAFSLAAEGRKIFVIDFDLEAPGLDSIMIGNQEPHQGLVEYIAQYKANRTPPPLKDFVVDITAPGLSGSVHLMPAGRKDTHYQIELNKIDWKDFYKRDDGFFFIENLKGQINSDFRPDYVLIDSRTGLTDIGGICTLHLPEVVVLVFNLNEQNLKGIQQVQRTIQYNHLHKDIKVVPVISPAPDMPTTNSPLATRIQRAQKLLEIPKIDLLIHYNAGMALEEKIMVLAEPQSPLTIQYQKISKRIISLNTSDFTVDLASARDEFRTGEWELAKSKFLAITSRFPDNFAVQFEAASFFRTTRSYKEALICALRAKQLKPNMPAAYLSLARTYWRLRKRNEAIAALKHIRPQMTALREDFDFVAIMKMCDELGQKKLHAFWLEETLSWIKSARTAHSGLTAVQLAEYLMSRDKFRQAVLIYQMLVRENPNDMIDSYNLAFALFRSKLPGYKEQFSKAIKLFEVFKRPDRPQECANLFLAMHFAYRHTGDFDKAFDSLNEAVRYALKSIDDNPSQRIFTPLGYEYIPPTQFIATCRRLIKEMMKSSKFKRRRKPRVK